MRRAPFSTASVLLGVALGVASVTGVHLLGESVNRSLDTLRPPHLQGITHVLTHPQLDVQRFAELRQRWSRGELPDVEALLPLLEGRAEDGTHVVATDWVGALTSGIAMPEVAVAQERDGTAGGLQGVFVRGAPIDARTVLVAGRELPVLGVLSGGALASSTRTVFTDLATGWAMLQPDDERLQAVLIRRQDAWTRIGEVLEWLMPGLSAGLPRQDAPLLGEFTAHDMHSELPGLALGRSILFNLGALGSLALLVALLLIYQTCVIWLRRQREVLRRLHAIGLDAGTLALGFFAALGLLTLVGVGAGLYLGQLLVAALLSVTAPEVGVAGVALSAAAVAKGVGAAVVVWLLGSGFAWRAEWDESQARAPRGWPVLALVLFALIAWGIGFEQSGLVGAFVSVLLLSLVFAFAATPLLYGLKRVVRRMRGPLLWRLAVRESAWFPGDLAIAVAGLALAVAVSIGVGLMVASFRAAFAEMLESRLASDYYVNLADDAAFADVQATVASWPEVTRVSRYGRAQVRLDGVPVELGYTRFDDWEAKRYGLSRALGDGEALASEGLARSLDAQVGGELDVAGRSVTVVGVFSGFGDAAARLLVDEATAATIVQGRLRHDRLSVMTDAPDALERRLRDAPWRESVTVTRQQDMRANALETFDQTFAITRALTLLALVIATVAVFNALTGFKLNQQASSELLNALGVDGLERRQIDLARALSVGVSAALLATPLGLLLGWVLCAIINPRAFGWTIELLLTAGPVVVPLAAGVLAALVAGAVGTPKEARWNNV